MTRRLLPLALALAAACAPLPEGGRRVAHELLGQGDRPATPAATAGPRQRVIDDAATLRRIFRDWAGRPAPTVDFARHRVVLLDAGPQPSAGHAIGVAGVHRAADGVVVAAVLRRPGEGCMSASVMTRPYAFVRIPAHGSPVRFEQRVESVPCG